MATEPAEHVRQKRHSPKSPQTRAAFLTAQGNHAKTFTSSGNKISFARVQCSSTSTSLQTQGCLPAEYIHLTFSKLSPRNFCHKLQILLCSQQGLRPVWCSLCGHYKMVTGTSARKVQGYHKPAHSGFSCGQTSTRLTTFFLPLKIKNLPVCQKLVPFPLVSFSGWDPFMHQGSWV